MSRRWMFTVPLLAAAFAGCGSAVFVIGSFFLAKELKVKRPQRRARRSRAVVAEPYS